MQHRTKNEEDMLILMDKSIHENNSSQQLQPHNKQFTNAVIILNGHHGIFIVTGKTDSSFFERSINDVDFNVKTIPPGASEFESLNNEIKRKVI